MQPGESRSARRGMIGARVFTLQSWVFAVRAVMCFSVSAVFWTVKACSSLDFAKLSLEHAAGILSSMFPLASVAVCGRVGQESGARELTQIMF